MGSVCVFCSLQNSIPFFTCFLAIKRLTKSISLNFFMAEMFVWSKTWKDWKKLCSTLGSSWTFQCPQTWVGQINHFKTFEKHFVNWQNGCTDKGNHVFWFIGAGTGCVKSRCLASWWISRNSQAGSCPNTKLWWIETKITGYVCIQNFLWKWHSTKRPYSSP